MKQIFRKSVCFSLVLASALFVSCNEDENPTLGERTVKSVATIDQSSFSVTEGDNIPVTITVDRATTRDIEYKLELVGGTGTFRDYECDGTETHVEDGMGVIGHKLVMPAYETSFTFNITPVLDMLPEGAETLQLRLVGQGNSLAVVAPGSDIITINVADYVSNDIAIELDWSATGKNAHGNLVPGEYEDAAGTHHEFNEYDFDFYVFDGAFNEVTGFAAATGNSPEHAVLLEADLADGDYYIFADLFDSGTAPASRFQFDIKLNVAKYGNWFHSIPLTYYSDNATSAPSGLNGGETFAAVLTKAGTTYTLTDPDSGDILVQGKMARMRDRIAQIKKNRRK